jgi:MoxR-like ATPase
LPRSSCRRAIGRLRATQPDSEAPAAAAKRHLRYGAGVRAAQTIVLGAKVRALLAGRAHVSFEDLKTIARPALRHRVILNFEGEAEGVRPDAVVGRVLDELGEMPPEVARLDR